MKRVVVRVVWVRSSSSSWRRVRSWASRAANGSSISSISGSTASARAMATRWRIPPESAAG